MVSRKHGVQGSGWGLVSGSVEGNSAVMRICTCTAGLHAQSQQAPERHCGKPPLSLSSKPSPVLPLSQLAPAHCPACSLPEGPSAAFASARQRCVAAAFVRATLPASLCTACVRAQHLQKGAGQRQLCCLCNHCMEQMLLL